MSKAFTREDDGDAPIAAPRRRGVPVPVPNFVTTRGLAAARAELDAIARDGDPDRARELAEHLATAQIGSAEDRELVGFGAAVTIEDDAGARTTYRIVGAIEADARRGLIGWQSALASVLWGARVGDSVELPRAVEVVVAAITYE